MKKKLAALRIILFLFIFCFPDFIHVTSSMHYDFPEFQNMDGEARSESASLSAGNRSRKFFWHEDRNSVALLNGEKTVWQYNFNKEEGKPYFHPLSTIDGSVLTALRPKDHPWHRGIWFSWKYINGLNYWEEDRVTGKSEGITELKSVKYKLNDQFGATFNLELSYHPPGEDDLLQEQRSVHLSAPGTDGSYYIDWETTFTAKADDVLLDRTPLPGESGGKSWGGYAGFSARLNNQLWNVNTLNDMGETEQLHGSLHAG